MYDLKSFKDYLKENFCSRQKRITNSWNFEDHESIARAFLAIKYCSLEDKNKWIGFFRFIVNASENGEWKRKPIWTSLLDRVAFQYLESVGISQNELSFIEKRVEKERGLNCFLNNKEEKY